MCIYVYKLQNNVVDDEENPHSQNFSSGVANVVKNK